MLTLELSPQTERALIEGARQRGVPLETFLESLLQAGSTPTPARALLGKYAHLPVSSENILSTRHEEVECEMEKS